MLVNQSIIADINAIISQSKDNAICAVEHQPTLMYRHIGKRIFEEEQQGNDAVVLENQKQIIASQYELYLPTEQQSLEEVNKKLESFEEKKKNKK